MSDEGCCRNIGVMRKVRIIVEFRFCGVWYVVLYLDGYLEFKFFVG